MGKHVAPGGSLYRSLLRPVLGLVAVGVVLGVVIGVGLWLAAGGEDETVVRASPTPSSPDLPVLARTSEPDVATPTTPVPMTPPAVETPDPTPVPTPDPAPTTEPEPEPEEEFREPVPVQVLNAGGGRERVDDVIATLDDMGYEIAAVNGVRRRVEETTVLWNENHQSDALDLIRRDERFAGEAKNDGYAQSVPLHVLVGPDWE